MARAHDAHGQGVLGRQFPADKQHPRRIVDLAQHAGIAGVGLDEDVDAVAAAQREFLLDVDGLSGGEDFFHQLGTDALDGAQLAAGGRQHGPRRAELSHEALPRPRPNALDQHQPQGIEQLVIRGTGGGVFGFSHGCTFRKDRVGRSITSQYQNCVPEYVTARESSLASARSHRSGRTDGKIEYDVLKLTNRSSQLRLVEVQSEVQPIAYAWLVSHLAIQLNVSLAIAG